MTLQFSTDLGKASVSLAFCALLSFYLDMAGGKKDSRATLGANEPLFGFMPRNVGAAQVQKAMVRPPLVHSQVYSAHTSFYIFPQDGDVNPFTKQPFTAGYKKIMGMRKKLPVYAQMEEFYNVVSFA